MGTNKKKTKFFSLITYVIVLLCMIATFFVPLFGDGTMLIQELLGENGAISLFSIDVAGHRLVLSFLPEFFTKSFTITDSYYTINLAAAAVTAYAAVTVLGIIALIPIIAGRKRSKMPRFFAYLIEVLAMLSLLLFLYDRVTLIAESSTPWTYLHDSGEMGYPLLVMIPVLWLFMTMQSIKYKGSSGVVKSLLFLLSGAAVVCLFGRYYNKPVLWYVGSIADRFNFSYCFVGSDPFTQTGFVLINNVQTTISNFNVTSIESWFEVITMAVAMLAVLSLVIDTITLTSTSRRKVGRVFNWIRYFLEWVGAVAAIIIGFAFIDGVTPGIWLLGLAVIAFIEWLITCFRLGTKTKLSAYYEEDDSAEEEEEKRRKQEKKAAKKAKKAEKKATKKAEKQQIKEAKAAKKAKKAEKKEAEKAAAVAAVDGTAEPAKETDEKLSKKEAKKAAKEAKKAEKKAAKEAKKAKHEGVYADENDEDGEEVVEEYIDKDSALAHGFYEAKGSTSTQPPVYTRAYSYQDDGFLNSLTSAERAEFFAIFIDKRNGNYYFLPEYIIGGDNKEFFQTLFIYLGKFMGVLSDGLMSKIYRRLNILS